MKDIKNNEIEMVNGAGFTEFVGWVADTAEAVANAVDDALNEIGHGIYHLTKDDDEPQSCGTGG